MEDLVDAAHEAIVQGRRQLSNVGTFGPSVHRQSFQHLIKLPSLPDEGLATEMVSR